MFDHPVSKLPWYQLEYCPVWDDSPERLLTFITESFERSGELLTHFSDAQLEQGFWFLLNSDYMVGFGDKNVGLPLRVRALHSFIPLFEQVMVVRC